ncbi:hypothetical protein DACRYDRAFT_118528 [Dacryopinax primogenitus]|uniref:DUF6533 domain-containing protein n=1 Tax=Dacryopinax primogenitus (strain DJM 731) TaxID=1858805 RepID=M5G4S2_DACPD|nr:uncharacterized protein DACRYDRAFT_118528 [Dacryopinax primogenitus]EJT98737.1 hypothetical protein DACRYDRAFT_118528 [Dacryopinax primogenitus]
MSTTIEWSARDIVTLRGQNYVAIAAFCLMLYDHLLTLDVEVNLVWPAPLSLVKVLFLWNRYITPCTYIFTVYMMSGLMTPPTDPNLWYQFSYEFFLPSLTLEGISVNGIGAALMLLSVYALYNRHKGMLIMLSFLLALELLGSVIAGAFGVIGVSNDMFYIDEIHGCVFTQHKSWPFIVFLFMMLFDIVIFYLVARKTWHYAKTINAHRALIGVLLFDAVGYFVVMIAAEFLNIIAYTRFPASEQPHRS